MNSQKLLWIIGLTALVVISAGCGQQPVPGKYTGGGWILGVDGESKANFGFNLHSDGENMKGQVQYNDRSEEGVKFHGVVDFASCGEGSGYGSGTAILNPGGETGSFEIRVEDNGKPGEMDPADWIWISLETDSVSYVNEGNLCGGNAQYHP